MSEIELKACPFCGGDAERIEFGRGAGDNEGGSCVACTECGSSGPVEFGYKENFISKWNTRAPQWQPIDSAPRNGTRILIAMDGVDRAVLSYWDGAGFATIDGNDWTGRNITAWQPLPAQPEAY